MCTENRCLVAKRFTEYPFSKRFARVVLGFVIDEHPNFLECTQSNTLIILAESTQKLGSTLNKFGFRLRVLVEKKKPLSQEAIADAIGISPATLTNWLKRDYPPPGKVGLGEAARFFGVSEGYLRDGIPVSSVNPAELVEESPTKYGNTDVKNRKYIGEDPSSLNVNPRYRAAPASPTAEQCMQHLATYLDTVSEVPGGVARAWTELQLHLPLDEASRLRDNFEKNKT